LRELLAFPVEKCLQRSVPRACRSAGVTIGDEKAAGLPPKEGGKTEPQPTPAPAGEFNRLLSIAATPLEGNRHDVDIPCAPLWREQNIAFVDFVTLIQSNQARLSTEQPSFDHGCQCVPLADNLDKLLAQVGFGKLSRPFTQLRRVPATVLNLLCAQV